MATFVHLAPADRVAAIRRTGLIRLRGADWRRPGGVFAVPVTPSFYVSQQWLRELKRGRRGPLVGVYFRVPDAETVWAGHYGEKHLEMTAAQAVAHFLHGPTDGWEVVVPRRVAPREILRVKPLPQVVGWRYSPTAKGTKPCPCPFCTRGAYGGRKLRERAGVVREPG